MPNPLARITYRPPGTNPARPRAIAPVPEHVEGQNFAWRGMEEHGVEPTGKSVDPETYEVDDSEKVITTIAEPVEIPDPIPVTIVQKYRQEYREFGSDRVSLDFTTGGNLAGRAYELLGRDNDRISVRVKNCDASNIVLIGTTREEVTMRGYPLDPGESTTIVSESPIYVVCVSSTYDVPTTPTLVAYLAEYVVREQ